jgi:hypothetical protein
MMFHARVLFAFAVTVLNGCVMVPYTPNAEVAHRKAEVQDPAVVKLTIGTHKFLERMGAELTSRERRIEIIPALEFRDTAFPDGNWTLAALFDPDTRERIKPIKADYLVAFGPMHYKEDTSDNKMLVSVGFYGYADIDTRADLSAIVVDLGAGSLMELLVSECDATLRGVGAFYGLFIVPRTEHGVEEALADELVQMLKSAKPDGAIRVVIMAAESGDFEDDTLPPPGSSEALAYESLSDAQWKLNKEFRTYCPNADLGHADAQKHLADIYYHGLYGRKVDAVRAWVWYSLAIQNGDTQAAEQLAQVTAELTPEQLKEAKQQFESWKPGQCMQELTQNHNGQDLQ